MILFNYLYSISRSSISSMDAEVADDEGLNSLPKGLG